jgi:hypothetical protein
VIVVVWCTADYGTVASTEAAGLTLHAGGATTARLAPRAVFASETFAADATHWAVIAAHTNLMVVALDSHAIQIERARSAVTTVRWRASTGERACVVGARRVFVAVVGARRAFINVVTARAAVSAVAQRTGATLHTGCCFAALGERITWRRLRCATIVLVAAVFFR